MTHLQLELRTRALAITVPQPLPRWTLIVGMVTASLSPAIPCRAQTVSGSFEADPGGRIVPTFVGAYLARAESDARKQEVEIILSTVPVDLDSAMSALNPQLAVINEQRNSSRNHIVIRISGDKQVRVQVVMPVAVGEVIFSTEADTLVAELTPSTAGRVGGRVFTPAVFETRRGSKVTLDLTFSTPITVAPPSAPLPPGGGEPGDALSAFFAARNSQDWPTLKAAFSRAARLRFVNAANEDNENRINTLGDLNYLFPSRDPKITGGTLTGNMAVLEIESRMDSSHTRLTLVRMIKAASTWVFDDVAFVGMVP